MPQDRIRIVNMSFYGHHGVDPNERALGGRFSFDVELVLDLRAAGESDDLSSTVDYAAVYRLIGELQGRRTFMLLEALAHNIARAVLEGFPVEEVTVRARKHSVPLAGLIDHTEVEITRSRAMLAPDRDA
jgi:7,8-dihydroneopterin aldolase/epimerase/oxygenase